jgi:putative redox protein
MPRGIIRYQGAMAFEAEAESGHRLIMDSAPESGGTNRGFRPTELTALSLAGCTAMDVVSILTKMRCRIDRFEVSVEADRREPHPRVFDRIRLVFDLDGSCDARQFARAVALSAERYCSVSAMLEKTAVITRVLRLNGEEVEAVPLAETSSATPQGSGPT